MYVCMHVCMHVCVCACGVSKHERIGSYARFRDVKSDCDGALRPWERALKRREFLPKQLDLCPDRMCHSLMRTQRDTHTPTPRRRTEAGRVLWFRAGAVGPLSLPSRNAPARAVDATCPVLPDEGHSAVAHKHTHTHTPRTRLPPPIA
jgi:hypothetical protein